MQANLGGGIAGVLLGGVMNGSFVAPMKRMKRWQWENGWLVYSISGLLIIPWIVAFLSVPGLATILSEASADAMVKVLVFGFGWGVGSVLFGLGVARLGLAVGYGIILGLIAPIGTFLPLVVLHPDRLYTRQGATLVIGTVIVLAGIVMLARAGKIREHATATTRSAAASGFGTGLVICILSGLFSPMLNFAFVFGEELQRRALDAGASPTWASNAIWCLALTSGCIANAGYCVILLNRNRTWDRFSSANAPGGANWMLGIIMGVICFAGFMTYGTGATLLGPLGGIVGWPLFMSMALITSNLLGAATGEWRGAPRQAWLYSIAGIGLLIVAITIISSGGQS